MCEIPSPLTFPTPNPIEVIIFEKSAANVLNQKKKVIFSALLVLLTLLCILMAGEVLVRLIVSSSCMPKPPAVMTVVPYGINPHIVQMRPFVHFHIPGSKYVQRGATFSVTYEINSRGFRGPEIADKTRGARRLVIIGDSITEGHGVEFSETFAAHLESSLSDRGWEVVNAGVQGGSPIYYAANRKRYLSLEPDAVLFVLFQNDIEGDRHKESFYFNMPYLHNKSQLIKGRKKTIDLLKPRIPAVIRGMMGEVGRSPLEDLIHINRDLLEHYRSHDDQQLDDASNQQWEMSQRYLDYCVDYFTSRNTRVMIACLSLGDLSPLAAAPRHSDAQRLDEWVRTWAQGSGFPFLSLNSLVSEAFEEHDPFNIMIENDGHLTVYGHSLIAGAMEPWLLNQL